MNHLDKLISQYCPNGVQWVKLNKLGRFYGGLTGKSKADFVNGNAKFISYKNIYNNPALDMDIQEYVCIKPEESQNIVQFGDILFTGSSETPDECGLSSVVNIQPTENLYLNSFCFGFRMSKPQLLDINFAKHLFRSRELRQRIAKTADGVTRFNVSKEKFAQISIPLPPLPIQQEIVRILDSMTALIANLDSEIATRQQQYAHYRDKLLTFGNNVPRKTLGEVGILIRGNGLQKKDFCKSGVGCIHYGQIYTQFGMFADKTISFVEPKLAEKLTKVNTGDIIMATTGENVEDICKAVCWLGKESIVSGAHAVVYKHHQNPKYIAYCLHTQDFYAQKTHYAYGAKVIDIRTDKLASITIPLPPLSVQQKIVAKLDAFESLLATLRRERALRQQQYEYYRERLLSFHNTK